MPKINLILIALFLVQSQSVIAREKRNCPKESEVEKILNLTDDAKHKVDEVKRLDSIKTDDAYLHIFIGIKNDDSYRVLIFNNQDEYLGCYDTGAYEPYQINGDGDRMAYVVVMKKEDDQSGGTWINGIPFGKKGPWESIRTEPHMSTEDGRKETILIRTFTPTSAYSPSPITTEKRKWIMRGGKEVIGRLVLLTDTFIYIQESDGCIETLPRKFISDDDKKYIKSVKNTL